MHAGNYHIVGADLRQLPEFESRLRQSGIDFDLPTLFIAECVLVYIETALTNDLLKWIATNFKTVAFINYEQVGWLSLCSIFSTLRMSTHVSCVCRPT